MLWNSLPEILKFGPWPIAKNEIFMATQLSFAFTNLKPVLPGHVLVAPKRVVERVEDLTTEETADLFELARKAGVVVKTAHPPADALTLTVQDGKAAGQTVPHVHVHVMPRHKEDKFNKELRNDDIYKELERVDSTRPARTRDDMCVEAGFLREVASKLEK
jgi:bis(5'-adenosyl)-triphosphatase